MCLTCWPNDGHDGEPEIIDIKGTFLSVERGSNEISTEAPRF